jgi:hypothetical protein
MVRERPRPVGGFRVFLASVLLDIVFRRIPRVPGGRFRFSAQCDVLDHQNGGGLAWGWGFVGDAAPGRRAQLRVWCTDR